MTTLRNALPRPTPVSLVTLSAFVVGPLLTVVAVKRPVLCLVPLAAALLIGLAWRSIAIPLGLAGLSTALIAVLGPNPLPHAVGPIATSGWVAVGGLFLVVRGRTRLHGELLRSPLVLATLAIGVLLVVRLPGSSDPGYAHSKIVLYVLNDAVMLLAGVLLARYRKDIELFLVLMLVLDALSGLLILAGVGHDATSPADRVTFVGENVIALGIQGARGLMVATYLALEGTRRWMRTLALALLPLVAVALFASGSRGPVIGGVIGELVVLALLLRGHAGAVRLLALATAAIVTAVAVAQFVPQQALARSTSILTGDHSGYSSNGRSQLWQGALTAFSDHPLLGIGTGSFVTVAEEVACPGPGCGVQYPHNMLLELAAELGILGLAFGLIFLGASSARVVRAVAAGARSHPESIVVAALFSGSFVTAMLTGDISGNGNLWLAAGLALGLTHVSAGDGATAAEAAPGTARRPLPAPADASRR
jgi:O-antigen ligase